MHSDLSPSSELLTSLDFPRIKILTVGNVMVGKSCLIKRYCENRFVNKYIPTIGIDYGVKKFEVNTIKYNEIKRKMQATEQKEIVSNTTNTNRPTLPPNAVRVNFWDVAGGDEYAEVRNEFYESAQGIILVYDVRNQDSFDDLDKWWTEMSTYIPLPTIIDHDSTVINADKNKEGVEKLRKASLTLTTNTTPAGKVVGSNNGQVPLIVLCANKVDDILTTSDNTTTNSNHNAATKRVVSEAAGREWANRHRCTAYVETSASSGVNVVEMLESLFYKVIITLM